VPRTLRKMPDISSYDGTRLSYHLRGDGPPLICLPGGPGMSSAYLEDLGGLDAHHTLVLLDPRGTGDSDAPADSSGYGLERVARDVEALRVHLGLETIDLIGHSAGGSTALIYAARHPERLARLLLITPSLRAVGLAPIGYQEVIAGRRDEPWYAEVEPAWDALVAAPEDTPLEELTRLRLAAAAFSYGRWDERARAHAAAQEQQRDPTAYQGFYAGFAPDFTETRAALGRVRAPVLILVGGLDAVPTPAAARPLADLFPDATLHVQPGAGHFPWVDDAKAFVTALATPTPTPTPR